jgi:hypothetical protein
MSSNKVIHVNGNNLTNIIKKEEKRLEELNQFIIEYKELEKNLTWKSDIKNAVMIDYIQNIKDFETIAKKIDAFIKFLYYASNNYDEGLEEVKRETQKTEDNIELRGTQDGN